MRTLSGALLGQHAKYKVHNKTTIDDDESSNKSAFRNSTASSFHKFLKYNVFRCTTSLKYAAFTTLFFTMTFYFHMFLQNEYYKHCKSNVFRVVLFNESYMCTHMANILNLIETSYIVSVKRFIRAVFGI